jgi:hypothetical protein
MMATLALAANPSPMGRVERLLFSLGEKAAAWNAAR